ncbi:MAG: hypothetical protein ABII25_07320 [bacterium]
MEIKLSLRNILLGCAIIFVFIGLIIYAIRKKDNSRGTLQLAPAADLGKIIIQSKIKKSTAPESKPKGKIIPPAPSYKIENIRRKLNLPEPEEEEKDTRRLQEEILKKDPHAQFIF